MERTTARNDHPARGDLEIESALAGERAAALGRAGLRLERAVTAHRVAAAAGGLTDDQEAMLLDHIAARLYALLVQRECAGARSDNLEAISRAYEVPRAAVWRL